MVDFEVVQLPETEHVGEGDVAPDFTRPLVNPEYWEDASLSDLDTPLLLVFYTMDGAFPATYIWNTIRDKGWGRGRFEDVTVVGLSISDPYKHSEFLEERGIDYRLFSDPSNEVAEKYGIVNDLDGMSGIEEPRPAVFLIGEGREVEYAWVAEEWPDFPEYDEVEEAMESL